MAVAGEKIRFFAFLRKWRGTVCQCRNREYIGYLLIELLFLLHASFVRSARTSSGVCMHRDLARYPRVTVVSKSARRFYWNSRMFVHADFKRSSNGIKNRDDDSLMNARPHNQHRTCQHSKGVNYNRFYCYTHACMHTDIKLNRSRTASQQNERESR